MDSEQDSRKDRPVLSGLIALVAVAVAIGLLGGLAVMIGVKATGIDNTSSATDESATPSTFNLPRPTGTYQAGEGAILQVQRLENGTWSDFPVTMSVSGGTFATYVQTAQVGPNQFRVVDTDSQVVSNEVTVTVG